MSIESNENLSAENAGHFAIVPDVVRETSFSWITRDNQVILIYRDGGFYEPYIARYSPELDTRFYLSVHGNLSIETMRPYVDFSKQYFLYDFDKPSLSGTDYTQYGLIGVSDKYVMSVLGLPIQIRMALDGTNI